MKVEINNLKISLGHIVKDFESMIGYCGESGYGWDYGTIEDAKCLKCIEKFNQK